MHGQSESVETKLAIFRHKFPRPDGYNTDRIALSETLIREEFKEVMEALANYEVASEFARIWKSDQLAKYILRKRRAELLKELCDLVYVAVDAAIAEKLPFDVAFNRVHASNMSKLGEDGKPVYREDGKIMKSKNYLPAVLEDLV